MAPNFKHMGPACCCCKDIWYFSRFKYKMGTPATLEWTPGGTNHGLGDFDHVNRKALYSTRTGASPTTLNVLLRDDPSQTNTVVLSRTVDGEEIPNLEWIGCVDPDNQRIIDVYLRNVAPFDDELVFSKCNYDGTGDTELFTLPVIDAPDLYFNIKLMHYNRATETVFAWLYKSAVGSPVSLNDSHEIIEFDLLGNPHSVIHSFPVVNQLTAGVYSAQVRELEIDYTNNKLVWEIYEVPTDLAGNIDRKVMRSDFDGANVETLRSENSSAYPYSHMGWRFSHKDNCFYLSTHNGGAPTGDTTNGWFRVEPDWSDQELLISRHDSQFDAFAFQLGCGYETLGANSPA